VPNALSTANSPNAQSVALKICARRMIAPSARPFALPLNATPLVLLLKLTALLCVKRLSALGLAPNPPLAHDPSVN
jgi:hypothetical protein